MGIFSFIKSNSVLGKEVNGEIRYFSLVDWWNREFNVEEQNYIESQYRSVTDEKFSETSQTATAFLYNLASWFNDREHRYLALRILTKAKEMNRKNGNFKNILDEHFTLSTFIDVYYKERSNSDSLNNAISACLEQISIAPQAATAFRETYPHQGLPSHRGYEQLAIILDKQQKRTEAIRICVQASEQGWAGDWHKRIIRYKKK